MSSGGGGAVKTLGAPLRDRSPWFTRKIWGIRYKKPPGPRGLWFAGASRP